MDISFLVVGIVFLVLGIIMMTKYKFYKYETSDMMFPATLRAFLGSAVLALLGLLVLYYELKKL
jgi:hypothetical protein